MSTDHQEIATDKKKKRVPVVPPCPPGVATAYLVLRGAVLGVIGANAEDVSVSILQPTYVKENALSGKFSMGLGKKFGCGRVQVSNEISDILLNAIEEAANRILVEGSREIYTMTLSKQEAVDRFGNGIMNASHAKIKPEDSVLIACIEGVVICIPPSVPYASTSTLTSIALERENSSATGGKKARKSDVTLKFRVVEQNGEGTLATPQDNIPVFHQVDVMPEGLTLLQLQHEQEQLEQVTEQVAETQVVEEEKMEVDPFHVSGKIDYTKLVEQFGSKLMDPSLLQRLQSCIKVPTLHRFLRRNIFFSHRDFNIILNQVENKKPIYLYTGRGPSSSAMHLGHLIPFLFTQWLQEAFDCPLVIQMTDDEKFLFKGEYSDETGDNLNSFYDLTMENARDIIACGFDFDKTFLFSDLDYVGVMYPNICRIWKAVTTNTVNGIFGFDGSSNIGKVAFPAVQAAPSFASSFPVVLNATKESDMACLIPCAIDQDPYFRMTRDVAHKLVGKNHALGGKPALIHSKFFPPLQGAKGKMSSSDTNSAVFLTDTSQEIEKKIKEYAYSGGQETKALQQEKGADLDEDVAYQWLRFFLEDDEELERIGQEYGSGSGEYWSTGKVKQRLVEVLQELVAQHQERRAKITDEEVRKWMVERRIV